MGEELDLTNICQGQTKDGQAPISLPAQNNNTGNVERTERPSLTPSPSYITLSLITQLRIIGPKMVE